MVEIKKAAIAPTQTPTKRKSLIQLAGEVKQEVKVIDWTAKEELKFYTKVVIGATFLFGMGIYCADLIIRSALQTIGLLARWIGG